VALPSDESEEEEEYVLYPLRTLSIHQRITTTSIGDSAASEPVAALQCAALLMLLPPMRPKGCIHCSLSSAEGAMRQFALSTQSIQATKLIIVSAQIRGF